MTTKDMNAFVDGIQQLRMVDDFRREQTRLMAKDIVEAQNPKTLDEAKQFAQNWIETAAQNLRNEEYWATRARDAEALLRRCIDVNDGLWALGTQWGDAHGKEEELKIRGQSDALHADVRAALGDK